MTRIAVPGRTLRRGFYRRDSRAVAVELLNKKIAAEKFSFRLEPVSRLSNEKTDFMAVRALPKTR